MSANNIQIGGEHYKSELQHWDYAAANYGPGYFKGNATKYLSRWRKKNGLQDLQKARHYVQKMREVDWEAYGFSLATSNNIAPTTFSLANAIYARDAEVILLIHSAAGIRDLDAVLEELDNLIEDVEEAQKQAAPGPLGFGEAELS